MSDDGRLAGSGFDAASERSLRREGLRGRIRVRAGRATLHLEGSKSGSLAIPAGLVERIRFGRLPTRSGGPAWRALIWRKGFDRPLFLATLDRNYGPVMREFAGHVASGGLARIERGPSPLQLYLVYPVLVLALAGMAAGGAWEALRGGTLWYWGFVAAMVAIILFFVRAIRADWPRSITDLAELDDLLPYG